MRRTLLLAAATMLAAPLTFGQASAASAPDVGWAKSKAAATSVVEHTGYCGRWSWRCAKRWGWGTRKYYRCLWRHGC
ncbi:MAG: hypothetical protein K8F92_05500 [Hyphomicrobium sp.]|uniref:hypothetical protein n=1 Tax=Hyphomicrobium sp. TaxID=82 RepID=UPI00132292CE|nr:hypothetical protein [Hyphomicrobium sp.]KAB2939723.1 MAG: hypothetical protein F9K20_15605 [Hyphomicrobium sp.]MBZ0209092.1 hypothetical protein [Hyphomicrobium sp.]MCZ7594529.1 hypothetical protein [Hyphomicrobium sp.]